MIPPPPPPPPPPPSFANAAPVPAPPTRPLVSTSQPEGAFLVELFIFNAFPYKDHWAYWVSSGPDTTRGNYIHAFGDVRNGFTFEIRRRHDCSDPSDQPTTRIPLQWVDVKYFNEAAMQNEGGTTIDGVPLCEFEKHLHAVKVPDRSLNVVIDKYAPVEKVKQRNCQTWIVEAADQLVADGIFTTETAEYLHAIEKSTSRIL